MYRDGGGFTAYVIPEWATICHPRMGHNMSSPNGPQYVILEWATICHPRMYLSGIHVPLSFPREPGGNPEKKWIPDKPTRG